ncbi:MAG TPA: methyl-accepting chemotaxis protein [Alkalispirochaeta sp.]|nr:methyl-accepting chemotaxis protein [Alkalispirochaeta sp.]
MGIMERITAPYRNEAVNFRIKVRNFAITLFVMAAMTALMSLIHIVSGNLSNLTSSAPALVVSVAALFVLPRRIYRSASTVYLLLLSLTPFTVMLVQSYESIRDVYMYIVFAAPILVLSLVIGYARFQLYVVAAIQFILGFFYFVLTVLPNFEREISDLVNSLVFAVIFYVLILVLADIAFRIEMRIMSILLANEERGRKRVQRMNSLLSSAGHSLAIGERLETIASEGAENARGIAHSTTEAEEQLDRLLQRVTASQEEQTRLTEGGRKVTREMEHQTEAVNRSIAAVEQMTASIREISRNAQEKAKITDDLTESAARTSQSFSSTMDILNRLNETSERVLQVIGVIEEMGERTSLLAMNAAIQASHAGDAGRGFGVVAQEIRKLSVETNDNSKQVRELLTQNNDETVRVVESSKENAALFEGIHHSITDVNQALVEIISAMGEVDQGTREIQEITGELQSIQSSVSLAVDEINQAISTGSAGFAAIASSTESAEHSLKQISSKTETVLEHANQLLELGRENATGIDEIRSNIDELDKTEST